MKFRHYVIIGLLFFAIAFLWIDRANVIHKWKDAEMTLEIRVRRTARMLEWCDEVIKILEEELESKGMTLEEIGKVIEEKEKKF